MRERLSPFAPGVFWAGVIVFVLGLVVVASNVTAGSGRAPVPTEYLLLGGVVLVLLSALMRPDLVQRALGVRSVRYGSNALVFSVAFLAILGLINYLGTQSRFEWRQDFTANKQFTLSQQTLQILENLKSDVKATAFFSPQAFGRQEAEDRLKEYHLHSPRFNFEFVDPIDRPDLARSLGLSRDGGIVFQAGDKKQEATSTSESDFTSALLKVTTDTPHAVYFITGHKERDINGFDDQGWGTARQWLEKDNYTVGTISLVLTSTIPTSATVLVLAGPQNALNDAEMKTLSDYLDRGGRLLVMVDPGDATKPNPIGALLDKWGVKYDNDEVLDPAQYPQGTSPLLPAVVQYQFSTITQKMNGLITVFPFSRSLARGENANTALTIQPLAQTSAQAWGETTLDPSVPAKYDEGKDLKGPVNLAMSVEGAAPISVTNTISDTTAQRKTRIVAFGTSELVSNRVLQQLQGVANIDLFVNSINWLAEDESLISIRPIKADTRTLTMTSVDTQKVFFLSVIALPLLVLLSGLAVWWRRR